MVLADCDDGGSSSSSSLNSNINSTGSIRIVGGGGCRSLALQEFGSNAKLVLSYLLTFRAKCHSLEAKEKFLF